MDHDTRLSSNTAGHFRDSTRHTIGKITASDNAKLIIGDVYTSCRDFMGELSPEEELHTILNVLKYRGMDERNATVLAATPESCLWIWQTSFMAWVQNLDQADHVFWITGKPGSGKSTLMKYIATSSQLHTLLIDTQGALPWTVVQFFYDFRAARSLPNQEQGMYRALLHQLLDSKIVSEAFLRTHELDASTVEKATSATLKKCLVDLLHSGDVRLILFIDGLDECTSSIRTLTLSLVEIGQCDAARVVVASRVDPTIHSILRDRQQIRIHEHNADGIDRYIEHEFRSIMSYTEVPQQSWGRLRKKVCNHAEGVFLAVHLSVETLIEMAMRGLTELELMEEVNTLPQGMDELYDRIFAQIPRNIRSEAAVLLRLLVDAPHVPTTEEIYELWLHVHYLVGAKQFSVNNISHQQFSTRLTGIIGSIISISYRRVRFMHETTRAYLVQRGIVQQWIYPTLSDQIQGPYWTFLYTDALYQVTTGLGTRAWEIFATLEPALYTGSDEHPDFTMIMDEDLEVCPPLSDILPFRYLCEYLETAIGALYSPLQSQLQHPQLAKALGSPLILCFRACQYTTFEYSKMQSEMRYLQRHTAHWRHDLCFAASHRWSSYIVQHAHDIGRLSRLEREYMFLCWLRGTRLSRWRPEPLKRTAQEVSLKWGYDNILRAGNSLTTRDIAYMMRIVEVCGPSDFLSELCEIKHQGDSPIITSLDPNDAEASFPTIVDAYHGEHLIEIWAQLDTDSLEANEFLFECLLQAGFDPRLHFKSQLSPRTRIDRAWKPILEQSRSGVALSKYQVLVRHGFSTSHEDEEHDDAFVRALRCLCYHMLEYHGDNICRQFKLDPELDQPNVQTDHSLTSETEMEVMAAIMRVVDANESLRHKRTVYMYGSFRRDLQSDETVLDALLRAMRRTSKENSPPCP